MNKISLHLWCGRIFMVSFWAGVLVLFLFLPGIINHFKPDRSLTIFTWPLMLDSAYLKRFEKEHGIKLYITYYDSSAALLSKLQASKGRGYDLIIADDHTAQLLIQKQLVKKINRKQLSFVDMLDPRLLSHYYDPTNEYTIPHYWALYGLGYDTRYFKENAPPASWDILFHPHYMPLKICMTDDPREALMIAAQYLYGTIDALKDSVACAHIKELLVQQKKYVEVYSISRCDNLLQAQTCPVGCITQPEVVRLKDSSIVFMNPVEGGFSVIDAFLLSRATTKDDLIYQFLNYVYQPQVVEHHSKRFGYCPPFKGACGQKYVLSPFFFENVISDSLINDQWIEILTS